MKKVRKEISIIFNQLKIKFDRFEEFEKNLNHISAQNQVRIVLFDLSFIFRFMYGKTIHNDTFDSVFNKDNVMILTLEVMNLFAHYKRFFTNRCNASVYFYIYRSKPTDSDTELEVTKNIIKLTDYFYGFNYAGNEMNVDGYEIDGLKIIKGTKILDKEELIKTVQNTIVYNFTSSELFTSYLYEICEIGLDNPFCVVYYDAGEVFVDKIEDYFMDGKYKGLFNEYDKKYQSGRKYNIFVPKPKLSIPLLDKSYHRVQYINGQDGEIKYHGKSKEKMDSLISQYNSGQYNLSERVTEFYKRVTTTFVDSTLSQNTLKRWGKKLFDTEIYNLDILQDDIFKIQWLLGVNNEKRTK